MDQIIIRGGQRLQGHLRINGAKNAALLVQCAALLTQRVTCLRHVPLLSDVRTMSRLLTELGCHVSGDRTLEIDPSRVIHGSLEAPYELVKTMRASVTVMGPLLARYGRARVSLPGGCAIGARPIDQHLKGLEALGATVRLEHGYVELEAKRLVGARFRFDKVTVGGTQNVLMAACLARGTTRIENAAQEPEVEDLAVVLTKMGAQIEGIGTSTLEIEGVDELAGVDHAIIPDRIEAGTFAIAAAITGGDVVLEDAPVRHMGATLDALRTAGVVCTREGDNLRITGTSDLRPLTLATSPYPGFPTDMQAQMTVLALCADGTSRIEETIFENRFMHVPELCRMGGRIRIEGNAAIIDGPCPLSGAPVMATDLRASASLVLAGLVASGTTEIRRVYHLDRGYEAIDERLRPLGADITRLSTEHM